MSDAKSQRVRRAPGKLLGGIERVGNKLPHPFMLFVYLALLVAIVSWIVSLVGVTVENPETGEQVAVRSLLSGNGLVYMLTSMISNFVEFPPLGLVLVIMLGIGLAQQVGLIEAVIKKVILGAPGPLVTTAVILVGICGNLASDAAFIVIPPLAALVFRSLGRHPLAGLAAGFAAVGAGFSANFIIAGTDALLSGIATEAAGIVNDAVTVTPISNWYFMSASTVLLTAVGVVVTEKIVEPRLGVYEGDADEHARDDSFAQATPEEKRGMRNALLATVAFVMVVAAVTAVPNSPLRNDNGGLLPSPLLDSIVPLLLLLFVTVGFAYGRTVGKITKSGDVPQLMANAIRDLSGFLVLVFAAAQAIAYFEWTHLGLWVAVKGAGLLQSVGASGLLALVAFSVITILLSMLIVSGSGLWAIEAPIFVPMFMLLGINPAYVQVAYRIADSSTNIVAPFNAFLAIMIGFMQEYDKKAGIGTLFALMIPYTVFFYLSWLVFFVIWTLLGLPVGPGEPLQLNTS